MTDPQDTGQHAHLPTKTSAQIGGPPVPESPDSSIPLQGMANPYAARGRTPSPQDRCPPAAQGWPRTQEWIALTSPKPEPRGSGWSSSALVEAGPLGHRIALPLATRDQYSDCRIASTQTAPQQHHGSRHCQSPCCPRPDTRSLRPPSTSRSMLAPDAGVDNTRVTQTGAQRLEDRLLH